MLFIKVPRGLFKFKSYLPKDVFDWISSISTPKLRKCIEKCVIKSAELLTKGQYSGGNVQQSHGEIYSDVNYKDFKSNLITKPKKENSRRSFLDRELNSNKKYDESLSHLMKFEDSLVNYVFFELIRIEYYLETNFKYTDNNSPYFELGHEISLNGLFLVLKIQKENTENPTKFVNKTTIKTIENNNEISQSAEHKLVEPDIHQQALPNKQEDTNKEIHSELITPVNDHPISIDEDEAKALEIMKQIKF